MKPIDYRNENWSQVRERVSGMRLSVYNAWLRFGPGTTREISRRSGIDILTLRPRTTDLYQLDLVELVDDPGAIGHDLPGTEGIYRAVAMDTAMNRFFSKQKEITQNPAQLTLI